MAPSPQPSADWPDLPLRIGTAKDFAHVRQFARDAAFDDATLCRVLSVKQLHETDTLDWNAIDLDTLPTALRWCIDVFYRGLPSPKAQSLAICGEQAFAALCALGLLAPALNAPAMVVCPVWVYPVDSFLIVSDRRDDAGGSTVIAGDDVVFPGLDAGTIRFLRFMPDVHDGDALDLCGGCGVGALHAARSGSHAVTVDVTPRSAAFAEFNARLNAVSVSSLCGDLYAPVRQRRFALITAHPPYVPTAGRAYVFRDGGDDGEAIIRRTVEGLPEHLQPGGRAMVVCAGRDTAEQTFEQRARAWLGEAAREFDIVFGLVKTLTINEVIENLQSQSRSQPLTEEDARALHARLTHLGTRQFAYGVLVLRRGDGPVDEPPLRVRLTDATVAADFGRLLDWRAFRRQDTFTSWLAAACPRFAPQAELTARHVAQDGRLIPAELTFRIDSAFQSALRLDPWMVPVLAAFDGQRTAKAVFDAAHGAGELPPGFAFADFAALGGLMIEHGFLDLVNGPSTA